MGCVGSFLERCRTYIKNEKVKWVHRFNQTYTHRVKETLTSVISELLGQRQKNCCRIDA